ncbi:ABC transporter substrate-binding protein, partial [Burkholderia cenocepacia]|nr:ABC transporter substrate-binding protein [Burkholderia cenocepacia]
MTDPSIGSRPATPAAGARICISGFDVCRPETDSVICPAAARPARITEDTPPMTHSSAPARRRALQRLAALAAAPLAGGLA